MAIHYFYRLHSCFKDQQILKLYVIAALWGKVLALYDGKSTARQIALRVCEGWPAKCSILAISDLSFPTH